MTTAGDHDTVLPRCRLAIHHGGSGTTAAMRTEDGPGEAARIITSAV